MSELETLYEQRVNITPFGSHVINEHMPTLRRYAEECPVIVEFGVEHGWSTTAFLAAHPAELHGYDPVRRDPDIARLEALAQAETPTRYTFHAEYSQEAAVPECDLLMIDSLHTYAQLSLELERHGNRSRRYILLHDTETFAVTDECPTPTMTAKQGLRAALAEFLAANPHWQVKEHYRHQNGLTVLERDVRPES